VFTNTLRSFLGRYSKAVNPWSKTFGYKKAKATTSRRLGANVTIEGDNAEPEEVMMVEVTWMQPYLAYMLHKSLPEDVVEARRIVRRIVRRSKAFVVVKGEQYKKSISGVLKDVLHHKRDMLYYTPFMQEFTVIMPTVEP
jgi:hypothetical protein